MIQDSSWINKEIKNEHDVNKCIKKQSEKFYKLLNEQCLKECDWCPFEYAGCTECGGVKEILLHECYSCNKCGAWD